MNDPYVLVLYYSRTGTIAELARHAARGVDSVDGIEARVRTVPAVSFETEASADPVPAAGPPYCSIEDIEGCAGLLLGSPTRFGNIAPALGQFLTGTVGLWTSGALVGRPAGVFTSTGSPHGGHETTALSMMLPLLHHGMVLVGVPYPHSGLQGHPDGGSPYAAGAIADGSRSAPNEAEQAIARYQGTRLARAARALAGGIDG